MISLTTRLPPTSKSGHVGTTDNLSKHLPGRKLEQEHVVYNEIWNRTQWRGQNRHGKDETVPDFLDYLSVQRLIDTKSTCYSQGYTEFAKCARS